MPQIQFCYTRGILFLNEYHKNTNQNATKIPSEIPQKYQSKYHKNTK